MSSETKPLFVCPQCETPVKLLDTRCPSCGVNLALAAAQAERRLLAAEAFVPGSPYLADMHLPRFGEFLVRRGVITESQLEAALARQKSLTTQSWRSTIGQILLEMGMATIEQLDEAGREQQQYLHSALQDSNRQLEQQTERVRELQKTINRLIEYNQFRVKFLSGVSQEMQSLVAEAQAGQNKERALGRMNELAGELTRFAASVKDDNEAKAE
ncbi:MAG: hypothetical protein HYZ49_00270 [Chloroflexi bacterium]|nr:hypothetical protein [Chloroflexota bacterium]